jgi:hypothetical protein
MLSDPTRLDIVSFDPDNKVYRLIIVVEDGEWLDPKAAHLLNEKVNAYAIFALHGQLDKVREPSHGDAPAEVVITASSLPPPSIDALIKRLRDVLESNALPLRFEIRAAA